MDTLNVPFVTILGFIFVVLVVAIILSKSLYTINTRDRGLIERFGKFNSVVGAGLHLKNPFSDRVIPINMQVQQLDVEIETKTKDNVFVKIPVSIQHKVIEGKEQDAHYKLINPGEQIEAYVRNVILGHVPKMTLDDTFAEQQDIALQVQKELDIPMEQYGYQIVKALVTDIIPDPKVAAAMNDINAAAREREAAISRGETNKTLLVKNAEAEAESKRLQGEGIANQRKAIIAGLQESVKAFEQAVEGATAKDVMNLVLMTQYFDTLKEIGASGKSNTLLLPHSPGTLGDLANQMREVIASGQIIAQKGE